MPRVVPDQREKFENDELFRKLSRESEVSVYFFGRLLPELYSCHDILTVAICSQTLPTSHSFQARYTGYRDRPHEERQVRFQTECREGHADIVSSQNYFPFFEESWKLLCLTSALKFGKCNMASRERHFMTHHCLIVAGRSK